MERFSKIFTKNKDPIYVEPFERELIKPNITWQHVWSLDETRSAVLKSVFVEVPNEIVLRIFTLLSVRDLCNISLVCRHFKMIADADEIWKQKCNTSTKLYSKSFKQIYMEWMYVKCLHNIKLRRMREPSDFGCDIWLPPPYPTRPTDKQQFEAIGGFHQHPNSSSSMSIKLSVDIEKTAPELIKLLEKATEFQQQWQQSSIAKQMITRYYKFMQLKAFHPSNILLIPTLDIEIVWQTHLLRPAMYQADCLRLFRRVIDHSLLISNIHKFLKDEAFQDTCQLYEQRFGEQYCSLPLISTHKRKKVKSNISFVQFNTDTDIDSTYSYWDKTHFEFSSEPPRDYENPFSFTEGDLIMDGKWLHLCKQFMLNALKNVPVDDYYRTEMDVIDLGFGAIIRLKKSYERFLYMAAKYPMQSGHEFIRPTYAIDIMWHSHMQEPLNYIADCVRLIGYVVYHSPWPTNEDETMTKRCTQANDVWKNEFKADLMTDHLFNTADIWFCESD